MKYYWFMMGANSNSERTPREAVEYLPMTDGEVLLLILIFTFAFLFAGLIGYFVYKSGGGGSCIPISPPIHPSKKPRAASSAATPKRKKGKYLSPKKKNLPRPTDDRD